LSAIVRLLAARCGTEVWLLDLDEHGEPLLTGPEHTLRGREALLVGGVSDVGGFS